MAEPLETIVYDDLTPCPYLPGESARMPLRLPRRRLSREEFDTRLAAGDRRSGPVLYRPTCPSCNACEAIRLEIARFCPNRSQRRALARGDLELSTEIGPALADGERVALYNRHRRLRGLEHREGAASASDYRQFLVVSCCETFELRYRLEGALVGVALVDRAADSLSAVYCYFDPSHDRLSLGTYSILKQIELCGLWGLSYLYLGLYVARSRHMAYKGNFLPHQRLVDGEWREFGGVGGRR